MVMNDNNVNMNELDQLSTPMAAIQSPISNTDNIKKVAYSALPICLSLMSGLVGLPADAQAATTDALTPLFSAFTAYGHYFGLVVVTAALMTERLLIKPGMPIEDQKKVIIADIIYGIVGLLIVVTGYLRVTQYGKGWDFYSHEPVFWVKLVLVGIWGSSSLFPTIKLIQRGLMIKDLDDGKVTSIEPVSEKLSARLTKIINGK